jgi:hypothetical protein
VVMVRPHHFSPNPDTAADNSFQAFDEHRSAIEIAADAEREVTTAAETLRAVGVDVHLFDDYEASRPDSVFPNNWFSTHSGGHVAIYPMYSPSRRTERRVDVIDTLKEKFRVQDVIDYSGLEHDNVFLEGTGAMVLDHVTRVAYAARSNRANPIALERFCTNFGYEPMAFDATNEAGVPVYHTNVMMAIATDFVMVGLDMIADAQRRREVIERLTSPGRAVVGLSYEQINNFAGNAIELRGRDGRVLALSQRAYDSLRDEQRDVISRSCTLLPLDVPTIELAGGSVRCMIAGIHLDRRPVAAPLQKSA